MTSDQDATPQSTVHSLDEVRGVWRRSLLVRPDGTRDATGFVVWMQGLRHFVDLRQPAGRPCFAGVATAHDLTWLQLAWMARQEGFAGELVLDGGFVEWRRSLDFQPPSGVPDSARLWFEGATLVEQGRHAPYSERWEPLPAAAPRRDATARLREGGRDAAVVRCDDRFMVMVGRDAALPPGASLPAILATKPTLAEAQRLVACEISLSRVSSEGWRIERSTLPWREGAVMAPRFVPGQKWLGAADGPAWDIVEADGDVAALVA